jgi:hypothetical protein
MLAKAKGNVYKGRKPALNAKQIAQLCTGGNRSQQNKVSERVWDKP